MSTALKIRDDAVVPFTPAADYSALRGYGVTLAGDVATVGASATVPHEGVILEAGTVAGGVQVGILGAVKGTIGMKTSGALTKGAKVVQAADGTIVTDPGSGGRVIVGIALEDAVSGDIIEVAPLTPTILS